MAIITVLKKVSWKDSSGQVRTGKVKNLFSDYAVVETNQGMYVVKKNDLIVEKNK